VGKLGKYLQPPLTHLHFHSNRWLLHKFYNIIDISLQNQLCQAEFVLGVELELSSTLIHVMKQPVLRREAYCYRPVMNDEVVYYDWSWLFIVMCWTVTNCSNLENRTNNSNIFNQCLSRPNTLVFVQTQIVFNLC
jgi:hypothetical protein